MAIASWLANWRRGLRNVLPPLLEGSEDSSDAVYSCVGRLVRRTRQGRVCCASAFLRAYGGVREQPRRSQPLPRARDHGPRLGTRRFRACHAGLWAAPRLRFTAARIKSGRSCRAWRRRSASRAFALSEPDAGSDVERISTTATRDGEFLAPRRSKDVDLQRRPRCSSMSSSRARARGPEPKACPPSSSMPTPRAWTRRERIEVIAPHPLGTLRFTDCRVPADCHAGQAGRRIQDCHGHARHFPLHGGRRRVGFRPPGVGRGNAAGAQAAHVRPSAGRVPVDSGKARRTWRYRSTLRRC